MSDIKYKKYVIEFKLYDGTTRQIPIEIPTGEDGGYYTPTVTQLNDTAMQIGFTPSKPDMPAVQPVQITLPVNPDSGENVVFVVQDAAPEDTSVLWVDPTDNSDDGFQEAVNTALAQAKESGEFDGKDGVVQVTGATVGQTVKIAEVDENGVPTAWLPTDFPSGGGEEYETIVDFINEKACGSIIFNTDINGQPFALKKAIYEIYSTAENGSWSTYDPIYFNGVSKGGFITNTVHATGDSYLWNFEGKPSTVTTETWTAYLYARWEVELNEESVIVGRGRTATFYKDADGNYFGTNGGAGGWNSNTENFFISRYPFEGGITEIKTNFAYKGINAGMRFILKGVRM